MRSQKSNRERWNSTWEYIQASRRRSRGSWPKCGWFDPNNDNNNNDNNINDNHTKRLLPWYCWLIYKIALEAQRRWNKENPSIVTHLICRKPQKHKGLWKKTLIFRSPCSTFSLTCSTGTKLSSLHIFAPQGMSGMTHNPSHGTSDQEIEVHCHHFVVDT